MRASPALAPPAPQHEVLHAGRMVFAVTVGLVGLGLVMVYSTTSAAAGRAPAVLDLLRPLDAAHSNPSAALMRQLRWVLIAAVAGLVAARMPLTWVRRFAKPALLINLALLALVLAIGPERNRSRRWLTLGGLSMQPSELLKITALAWVAHCLASRERATAFGHRGKLLAFLVPVAVGVGLVLVAPDLGTSLFIVAEVIVLLALAGVRPTRVIPFVLFSLPLLVIYGYTRFGHVRERLATYVGPAKDGTQVQEGLVAIGSGGLFGRGLGEGVQKLGYIAESQTDFIFAIIGEELGLLGTAGVVLAFMTFVWYGRKVAWEARALGPHAFYLAAGATFIVGFQALVNIAVVTATAPTKGVSLPFISVGGSNLVVVSICVGWIVNVARRTAAEKASDPWA